MASATAKKRLMKEQASMEANPPPYVYARPEESNLLNWHYVLRGPPGSPYEGGEYHGILMFPPSYPFAPPGIKMYTPSGRFQPDRKLCTSMSDFHPGSWNPAWSVSTILTGLLSFMLDEEMTTGAIRSTAAERRVFAARSREWNREPSKNRKFTEVFSDLLDPTATRTLDSILDAGGPIPLPSFNPPASAPPPVAAPPPAAAGGAVGGEVERPRTAWERWRWALLLLAAVLLSRLTGRS